MTPRLIGAVLAAWVVVLVELIVTASTRPELAGIWEIQYGSFWLLPTALIAAGALGLTGGLLGWLLIRGTPLSVAALALTIAAGGASVAWFVSTGRHFDNPLVRASFVAVVGLAGGALAWALAPRLRRLALGRPRRYVLTVLLAILALEIANANVLVRLYPAFHLAVAMVTLILSGLIPFGFDEGGRLPRRRAGLYWALAVGAFAVLGLSATAAARNLRNFDNYRLVMLHHAPLLGQAVRLAARVAPERSDAACAGPGCAEPDRGRGGARVELGGHDILLITIDALRADHVGAYGYDRPTTPEMDALAADGVVFERAYCPSPHTSYSVTSLLTGKYMRPLLLQGAGLDSETLATLLRRYGYQTAAFFPPAVFFIDRSRFEPFEEQGLGFEYRKVEFLEGKPRVEQVRRYLDGAESGRRQFIWVHLFGPHEPYEQHADFDFGDRDVDRYDSEIAAADRTVGQIVEAVHDARKRVLTIVTSDHGEEFGDHGGRYHGTTVYEEQVRVPLIVHAPERIRPGRVTVPVQTIDLVPTLLEGVDIPVPPRVRGRSLAAPLIGQGGDEGFAFAETDEQTLLAEGKQRLVCARRIGACSLYDIEADPTQQDDRAAERPDVVQAMRKRLDALTASHGVYEDRGLRAGGTDWPPAVLRGLAGDADAAPELAGLLDDADVRVRRKAAELLFEIGRAETTPALRLALRRDEDEIVRRYSALALTRLGEGAPLARELVRSKDVQWRRLSALALAEAGEDVGSDILIDWWMRAPPEEHARSVQLLRAFAGLGTRRVVWPLVQRLDDVRLRPELARTLAAIGDDTAVGPLVRALRRERYQGAREAIARALVELGAREELARPLVRFLGTPDPLEGGLGIARDAGILEHVGGPHLRHLERLGHDAHVGAAIRVVVPKGGNGEGFRLLVRAHNTGVGDGEIRVGRASQPLRYDNQGKPIRSRKLPTIHPENQVRVSVPAGETAGEVAAAIPDSLGLRPGLSVDLVVFADRGVAIEALAVVPLSDELPPPAPEPWTPETPDAGASTEEGPTVL